MNIDDLFTKKLIVGDEYLVFNSVTTAKTGIYLGSYYSSHYFAATHPLHNKLDPPRLNRVNEDIFKGRFGVMPAAIKNIKDLYVFCYYSNDADYIKIGAGLLQPDNKVQEPIMSNIVKSTLKKIREVYGIEAPERKIASLMLSKLPVELCSINEIGSVGVATINNSPAVIRLPRSRAIKAVVSSNRRAYSEDPDPDYIGAFEVVKKNVEVTKITRIVKQMFGNLFKDDQIEMFGKAFNGLLVSFATYNVQCIKGKDISYWYDINNYVSTKSRSSTLHGSCMRYSSLHSATRFYSIHPKCSMVIVTKGNKLYGRALVWELSDGKKYMDRIYFTTDSEKSLILEWGKANNIDYYHAKSDNSRMPMHVNLDLSSKEFVTEIQKEYLDDDTEDDSELDDALKFPYFDTFRSVTGNMAFMTNGVMNTSDVKDRMLHARYGTVGINNAGYVRRWMRDNRSNFVLDNSVRAWNVLKGHMVTAKEDEVVFVSIDNLFVLKDHCYEGRSGNWYRKTPEVINEEQRKASISKSEAEYTKVRATVEEDNLPF